jgi:hypothetical protein
MQPAAFRVTRKPDNNPRDRRKSLIHCIGRNLDFASALLNFLFAYTDF